jgi:hypothetical protein
MLSFAGGQGNRMEQTMRSWTTLAADGAVVLRLVPNMDGGAALFFKDRADRRAWKPVSQ